MSILSLFSYLLKTLNGLQIHKFRVRLNDGIVTTMRAGHLTGFPFITIFFGCITPPVFATTT
jgi:hypothetical protein